MHLLLRTLLGKEHEESHYLVRLVPEEQFFKISYGRRGLDLKRGLWEGAAGRGAAFPLRPRSPWVAGSPGASPPPWASPGSPPRALDTPLPPVDAPRLQVPQRPLIKAQHLLLVGQVGHRSRKRHDAGSPSAAARAPGKRLGGPTGGRAGRAAATSASAGEE